MQREVKHSSSKNNSRYFRPSQNTQKLRSLKSSLRLIQQLKQSLSEALAHINRALKRKLSEAVRVANVCHRVGE